ncbi:acyl carrier protein [bacterium]|nr:acyl carrier protein [bacterium]
MDRENLKSFIEQKIDEKVEMLGLERPELTDDYHLTGSGVFDSMDFFGLITDVEEEFQTEIDFTEHDPDVFTTLGGFMQCVLSSASNG